MRTLKHKERAMTKMIALWMLGIPVLVIVLLKVLGII
jgi:hypothetical protein